MVLEFPSAGAFDVVLEAFLLSSSRWCYGISFCFLTPRLAAATAAKPLQSCPTLRPHMLGEIKLKLKEKTN